MPIIKVPYDPFYFQVKTDPFEAARDFFSIPRGAISPFLPSFEKIKQCIDFSIQNPFDDENLVFLPTFVSKDHIPRYMHIDYGPKLNGTGISMCHVSGFKTVKMFESEKETEVRLPYITFDFLGKIFAPSGGMVDLADIRELVIYELARRGFNIHLISFDQYNTLETVTILVNEGYPCDRLSIDRTQSKLIVDYDKPNKIRRISTNGAFLAAWDSLREAFVGNRIKMPYHPDFELEAKHAERHILGSKVVVRCQSSSLSLDLLESMAGSVYNAINNECDVNISDADLPTNADEEYAMFYTNIGRGVDDSYFDDERLFDSPYEEIERIQ